MSKLKQVKGFTLIELVIVLAIAALVLAAILLAVGGAQRSQRDNTTKNSAGRVGQAIQNWSSNNNGAMPGVAAALGGNYLANITDGNGGNPLNSIGAATAGQEIRYSGQAICINGSGNPGPIAAQAGSRHYAVAYWVENGQQSICTDNQ